MQKIIGKASKRHADLFEDVEEGQMIEAIRDSVEDSIIIYNRDQQNNICLLEPIVHKARP